MNRRSHLLRTSMPALAAIALTCLFFAGAHAQTPTPTPTPSANAPDSLIAQISASANDSFAYDISGDGRFMVIESNGDIATLNPDNADNNREIFLFDYAQRRIFQITHTKSLLVNNTLPAVNATNADDFSNIQAEVSNERPFISHDGRFIVFSSNAYNDATGAGPGNFDASVAANAAALQADGNQEIFVYQIPPVPAADLTSGAEIPLVDLGAGTFTRVTNTPASTLPEPGTTTSTPFVADDNRDATINDDGSIIAFTSTRNLPTVNGHSNADGNPEIFIYNVKTGAFSQITDTVSASVGDPVFSDNPSISGNGSVVAFVSNADVTGAGTNTSNSAQVFLAGFDGNVVTSVRQITHTTPANAGVRVNIFSPGRRISRDGNFVAFESAANLAGDNTIQIFTAVFVYNVSTNTFTQVGVRPTLNSDLPLRFPTFTGDGSTLVFASDLNFDPDGTIDTSTTAGLNPVNSSEIFAAPLNNLASFTRLTSVPSSATAQSILPLPSDTITRVGFTTASELGGGNPTGTSQAFYLLVPPATGTDTPVSANAVSYATGATGRPVITATPSPTPTDAVTALAPGELSIATSTAVSLSPVTVAVSQSNAQENGRRPALPIELHGVSVSVNGAAAGLYFISPKQINFVVPVGLDATSGPTYQVVFHNNGAIVESTLTIAPAEPDIFSSTNGPGGRAMVFNVTNPLAPMPEPFTVTTTIPNSTGTGTQTVPTVLQVILTGVRLIGAGSVTVTVGTTAITGASITFAPGDNLSAVARTAGFDQIQFQLPASLAGAGDVPIVVTAGGQTSRTGATAPHITIN